MSKDYYEIESSRPFSQSLIWQLNRTFYQQKGITAWNKDIVPHNMTSSSMVGRTYAGLILAFLKDLAAKGKTKETVYILELGAGHGRLAFHILQHLQKLALPLGKKIPPFCYVLSDIAEDNLSFFNKHPQFKKYFDQQILDVAYFDASKSEELHLQHSNSKIRPQDLKQPIIAIANYFFDSIPTDLFLIQEKIISACAIALQSKEDPTQMDAEALINNMELTYSKQVLKKSFYEDPLLNEILEDYKDLLTNSHLFFPEQGIQCLKHLTNFSSEGLMVLSMDKGFHEIRDLENKKEPDIVTHGSFSLWVNYHALSAFCNKKGGKAIFPSWSTFNLNIGCLLFLPDSETYSLTEAAYQHFVNEFGPDDFNTIKDLSYFNVSRLKLKELIALYRLSAYDSTFFIKLLPRLKQVAKTITFNERKRLAQTLHKVWGMYFSISESYDLAYELAGIFYDLGFYTEALDHFQHSEDLHGIKADIYYNQGLCYYQLRQDQLFYKTLKEGKAAFPESKIFENLDRLDMN